MGLSMKVEETDSPAPSCASLKHPRENFKKEPPDLRMKQERSDSPTASCVSIKSEDPPEQVLMPDSSELTASLLTKDHFRCSVCAEVLKDPVSIPCGHSYCRQCITSYWAQPNHAGLYACPQCSHTYSSCPALYTNSALAQVVQKLQHFSPVLPADCYAGAGDVSCDFCTGRKLRAVKSCVTCMASYCETHIMQHYTVPALKRHTLVEPQTQELKPNDLHELKMEDLKWIKDEDPLKLLNQTFPSQFLDDDLRSQQGTPDQRAKIKKKATLDQTIPEKRMKLERSDSPAPSCASLKSMEQPQNFSAFPPQNSKVKLERSDSPGPSCLSLKSMEQPQNFSILTQHSGVKLERSDTPAPSCLSLKSMEQPQNFKGELTSDSRVKLERSDSPGPSCLSLKSMEQPQNFSTLTQHSGVKLERSGKVSPAPSSLSLKSMEQPQNLKDDFTPDSSMLLIVDHFRCSVCAEVLKDPVSIPCGHSYCRQCITSYWAQSNHAGLYACPQCSHTYSSCPALYTNSALAAVVHKLQHFSPVLPPDCYAGAGDVSCDFCTGRKLRAVKSCLTCMASYCETHLKEHYTVAALQTHTLTECEHYDQKDINCDVKTEELNQRKDEPGNQKPTISKLLEAKTEAMEHGVDTEVEASQPQVESAAVGPVAQAETEHQQQTQQTTESPGVQPQTSDTQNQLPAQENIENHENNSEKQGKSLDDNSQDSTPEKDPKEQLRLSIERCIQALVHACQCRNAKCSLPTCQKMKRVVQHFNGCKRKTNGGCPVVCKRLLALCCYHAKHCQENKCPVPLCLNIKHKLRQQQMLPGPEGSSSTSTPISSTQPAITQMPASLNSAPGLQPVMGGGSQAPQEQHPSIPPIKVARSQGRWRVHHSTLPKTVV